MKSFFFRFRQHLRRLLLAIALAMSLFIPGKTQLPQLSNPPDLSTITLDIANCLITDVFDEITRQTGMNFIYADALLLQIKPITLHIHDKSVEEALAEISRQTNLIFRQIDNTIAVRMGERMQIIMGAITDEDGEPMQGVNIVVKGTKTGTVTNADGRYSMIVPGDQAVLVFSYIGYGTQEITTDNRTVVNIEMKESIREMDDVVVVGYAAKKPVEITGSVQKISGKDLVNSVSTPNMASILKGKVTGLYVMDGADGVRSQSEVYIRGQSTLPDGSATGATQPLIVLDGVVMGNIDIMRLINVNDIESITVLKDAASTAIYGSRAALGVVVVTTKKGYEGTAVEVNLRGGVTYYRNRMQQMNTAQWIDATHQYLGTVWDESPDYQAMMSRDAFINSSRLETDAESNQYYNWDKALYDQGSFTDLHAGFRTGNQKMRLYGGLGWYHECGIRLNDQSDRMNFKLNADLQFTPWLTTSFLTSVVVNNSSVQNGVMTSLDYLPFLLPKDASGNWNKTLDYRNSLFGPGMIGYYDVPNILYEADAFSNTSEQRMLYGTGSFSLKLMPIEGLAIQTSNSILYGNTSLNSNYDSASPSGRYGNYASEPVYYSIMPDASMNGSLSIRNSNTITFLTSNTARYTRNFDKHGLSFLLGQEYSKTTAKWGQDDYYNMLTGERNPGAAKSFGNSSTALYGSAYAPLGGESESAMFSVFGEAGYNYDQRYVATASLRSDASPSFGKNKRYGTFYSLSGAWILSDEAFMAGAGKILSFAKLRYVYGTSGRALGTGVFLNKTYYNNSAAYNNIPMSGSVISQLANPDIGWETTYNQTLGLDFGLFNRINASVDLYHKRSSGLIQGVSLADTEGGFTRQQNVGEIVNEGVEALVQADIVKTRNFIWNFGFNISANHNKITKLAKDSLGVSFGDGARYYRKTGEDINVIKAIRYAGVNPDTGAPRFENFDDNGNTVYVESMTTGENDLRNYQTIGKATPRFYGGFQSTWTYKRLSLSTDWFFQVGNLVNNIMTVNYITPADAMAAGANMLQLPGSMKVWSGPGDNSANMPDIYATKMDYVDVNGNIGWNFFNMCNSAVWQDASYLRLRNIRLTYEIPGSFVQKCHMRGASVYVSVDNLFVIKKSGFWLNDPEAANLDPAYTDSATPGYFSQALSVVNPLRIVFGLNISF